MGKIDKYELVVYTLICRRYNQELERGIYETHKSMAETCNISENTLKRKLDDLVDKGLVDRVWYGKKRNAQWIYTPRGLPPKPAGDPESQEPITSPGEVKEKGLPQMTNVITSNDEGGSTSNPVDKKGAKPRRKNANRLINRLNSMCPKNQVTYVAENPEECSLKNRVQVAWNYWCFLWEEIYGSPYYVPKNPSNSKAVSRDKKNLRDKINAVGFTEVARRMKQCFQICDTTYPCVERGKWVRAITIGDFISNHLFNRFVPPPTERAEAGPISAEERIRIMRAKRG